MTRQDFLKGKPTQPETAECPRCGDTFPQSELSPETGLCEGCKREEDKAEGKAEKA